MSNKKGKQVATIQAKEGEDVPDLPRIDVLRLVNTVRGQPRDDKLCRRELMFIDVTLNERATRALVDTGAPTTLLQRRRPIN